jgi:predicted permease
MMGRLRNRMMLSFRSLLNRRRMESEMDDEIRFHLEARTADLIAGGATPVEARRLARVEFGATESHKDGMRAAFGVRWADNLIADLRYAARLLRKSPGFTAIAVSSLALAIGANTAIFSVANEMLYERLAIPRARELHMFYAVAKSPSVIHGSWGSNFRDEGGLEHMDSVAYPFYRQIVEDNRSGLEIFAVKTIYQLNVTANGQAQSARGQLVSGNYYKALEIKPILGRPILPTDDAVPGRGTVVVISYGFWQRSFGGAADVIGKSINVNGHLLTIVGVNPPEFTGVDSVQHSPELFIPLMMVKEFAPVFREDLLTGTGLAWVNLGARVSAGVEKSKAEAALTNTYQAAVRSALKQKEGESVPTIVLEDGSRGLSYIWSSRELGKPLHTLLGLSGLVLLLACANIANLMLARASGRQREMAVRLALGASRRRVLRQVMTESLLLASLGGTAGLIAGYLGRNSLPRLMESSFDGDITNVPFNWAIFGFAAGVTLLTGVLFGILPAWRATREDPNRGLKETAQSVTRRRGAWSGKITVAFQIALSTLLVASSALFLRTLINLNHIPTGIQADGLLLFDLSAPEARYPGAAAPALFERLEQRIAAAPGVSGVTALTPSFLSGGNWNGDFDIEGVAPVSIDKDDPSRYPNLMNVGRDFFNVAGIRIIRGRGFGPQDTSTSPAVAVINESTARKFFGNTDPIGRRFKDEEDAKHVKHYRTIVGICADTLYSNMREPAGPIHFDLYVDQKQFSGATFMVRSTRQPESLAADMRDIVRTMDVDIPLTRIRTQRQQIDANLQQERMFAALSSGFGLLALLLAMVGIYGIMAYTVTQRTHEIGIRLALGAQRKTVRSMVLREAVWLCVIGIVAGLAAVLAAVKLVKSMLYGLEGRDPASLIGTAGILMAVALVAAWVPAMRASRVEPMEALRHE